MSHKKIVSGLAALAVVSWSTLVLSHDPEKNPGKAAHGGQYVEYDVHHGIEMVAEKEAVVFHMTEHLQPVDMTGSEFKVHVQTEDGTEAFAAEPDGTKLVVDLKNPIPSGAKVVLTGKDSHGHRLQARFVIK